MEISHVALWTTRLDELRDFYCKYFNGVANEKYVNAVKGFESYFISFESGAQLEIMSRTDIKEAAPTLYTGFCHIAFSFGEKDEVVSLTERFRADGYEVAGEPRVTGDGYFESVICDPDGNLVELVTE